jgi:hypothetical protein
MTTPRENDLMTSGSWDTARADSVSSNAIGE